MNEEKDQIPEAQKSSDHSVTSSKVKDEVRESRKDIGDLVKQQMEATKNRHDEYQKSLLEGGDLSKLSPNVRVSITTQKFGSLAFFDSDANEKTEKSVNLSMSEAPARGGPPEGYPSAVVPPAETVIQSDVPTGRLPLPDAAANQDMAFGHPISDGGGSGNNPFSKHSIKPPDSTPKFHQGQYRPGEQAIPQKPGVVPPEPFESGTGPSARQAARNLDPRTAQQGMENITNQAQAHRQFEQAQKAAQNKALEEEAQKQAQKVLEGKKAGLDDLYKGWSSFASKENKLLAKETETSIEKTVATELEGAAVKGSPGKVKVVVALMMLGLTQGAFAEEGGKEVPHGKEAPTHGNDNLKHSDKGPDWTDKALTAAEKIGPALRVVQAGLEMAFPPAQVIDTLAESLCQSLIRIDNEPSNRYEKTTDQTNLDCLTFVLNTMQSPEHIPGGGGNFPQSPDGSKTLDPREIHARAVTAVQTMYGDAIRHEHEASAPQRNLEPDNSFFKNQSMAEAELRFQKDVLLHLLSPQHFKDPRETYKTIQLKPQLG